MVLPEDVAALGRLAKARGHGARWLFLGNPSGRAAAWPRPFRWLFGAATKPRRRSHAHRGSGASSPSCPGAVWPGFAMRARCALQPSGPLQLGEGAREASGAACPHHPGLLRGHCDRRSRPTPGPARAGLCPSGLCRGSILGPRRPSASTQVLARDRRPLSTGRPWFSHVCLLHSAGSHGPSPDGLLALGPAFRPGGLSARAPSPRVPRGQGRDGPRSLPLAFGI